ncbi:MAG: DJ-1/PfpI family protein [Planctomycetota bacterium]|jgi:putative intracellular protease/amidase|nr:DJ-1/PfpI family protein [Planctomycetota bacterium]MDP6762132.1 DJ-1/PfpI family protein [Planctomycetota bacterium]MDP6989251.1 DJ-1/PfpI family protein [Planctomycetota bacterium]
MADEQDSAGVDDDGLAIQERRSTVLIAVPSDGFDDQTLRHVRSSLNNVHVGTRAVSLSPEACVTGRLQDEFQVDGDLKQESMADYVGVVFVGCERDSEFLSDPDVLRLAAEADSTGKLIGAWGLASLALARAGILSKRRVTGAAEAAEEIRRAGGRYAGRQVVVDGNLVTGIDESSGLRLGKTIAQEVRI